MLFVGVLLLFKTSGQGVEVYRKNQDEVHEGLIPLIDLFRLFTHFFFRSPLSTSPPSLAAQFPLHFPRVRSYKRHNDQHVMQGVTPRILSSTFSQRKTLFFW